MPADEGYAAAGKVRSCIKNGKLTRLKKLFYSFG
jgi:hypothetical protein